MYGVPVKRGDERPRPDPVERAERRQRPDTPSWPAYDLRDSAFAALGLPAAVTHELARQGITEPFAIQTATIPDALAGRDVLGRGRTGSGKTLAFGLPMLTRLSVAGGRPGVPHGSQVPAALLLALDRLEEGLEVALPEAQRPMPLDDLEEDGRPVPEGLGEDLEEVALLVPVDKDPARRYDSILAFLTALESGVPADSLPPNPDGVPPVVRAYHFDPAPHGGPAPIEVEDFAIALALRLHVRELAAVLRTVWMYRPDAVIAESAEQDPP